MYSSTARVLAVLELLETHGKLRSAALAERLEVDTRTIRRYVMILRDRGIPIDMTRGRYGGYTLQPGFKNLLSFTPHEALALTLDLVHIHQQRAALPQPDREQALTKVLRVLPKHTRELVQRLAATITFADSATTAGGQGAPEHLALVLQAIQVQQRMCVCYRSWAGDMTQRQVAPYQVVVRHGVWYLVGYCHLRTNQRVFRLDHVRSLVLLDERFSPPAIDALTLVEQAIARTPWRWPYQVRVALPLAEVRRRIPATLAACEEQADGVVLRGFADDLDWLAYVLVGLRCPLVVLDPPELRTHLLTLAEHVRALALALNENIVVRPLRT